MSEAETLAASSECPVCGLDTPHYHAPPITRRPFAEKLAATEAENKRLLARQEHLEKLLKTAALLPQRSSYTFLKMLGEWPSDTATDYAADILGENALIPNARGKNDTLSATQPRSKDNADEG